MSSEERVRLEDVPRVRVRSRVVQRGDAPEPAIDQQRSALRDAERRFLSLQSSVTAGGSTEGLYDYMAILSDLGVIYGRLQEASGRRNISYLADRRLNSMNDYCRWLARRVSDEFLLLLQVHLEQELKRIISLEAYQVYLRLDEVADAARHVETLPDDDVMATLREGRLLREVLEQAQLEDVPGRAGHPAASAEASEKIEN